MKTRIFLFAAVISVFLALAAIASATRIVYTHVSWHGTNAGGAQVQCSSVYGTGITYTGGDGWATCYFSDSGGTIAVQAFWSGCWTDKLYDNPPPGSIRNAFLYLIYGGC